MPPVRTQAEFELQDQRKKVNTIQIALSRGNTGHALTKA
jgi:hypothetical protein